MAVNHNTTVWPDLGALLDCVKEEITASELEMPGYAAVHWGAVPFDHIGDGEESCGGELYVAYVTSYTYTNFPNPSVGPTLDGAKKLAAVATVGIVRCMPQPDADGATPTPEALFAVGQRAADDRDAIRRAICKCMKARTDKKWFLADAPPYGPAGQAVGVGWTLTFEE